MSTTCPACGSPRSRHAVTMRSFHFRRCRSCTSLWVENPPSGEELARLYEGESYFRNPEFGDAQAGGYHGYLDYLSDRRNIEAKFSEVLGHVEAQAGPGSLVDVGAGVGLMVSAAKARGWEAFGLDLNDWAVDLAREELGLDVRLGSLADAGLAEGSLDAVTMMDLLEHVSDPAVLVEEAAGALRPGGILAVLTPDAGSWVSRALGRRWPELIRAPEHLVLFSVRGLARLLEARGFDVIGWHHVGKTSSASTLLADVSPVAPGVLARLRVAVGRQRWGGAEFELNPRTKFCIYARRRVGSPSAAVRAPRRLPRRAPAQPPEEAVLEDLQTLACAERLAAWMFDQFADLVPAARVAEVGAGIGTFSERMLAAGAESLLLLEPEPACEAFLEDRFGGDSRVAIRSEGLPGAPSLAAGDDFDLVLCQNVLEHIADDSRAVSEMAAALTPGGSAVILVPAHPSLFGSLDLAYGHRRRYTRESLATVIGDAGLRLDSMRAFNLLGVLGWYVSTRLSRTRVGTGAVRAYESIVSAWRPIEDRLRPPWGLSLVARASAGPAGEHEHH